MRSRNRLLSTAALGPAGEPAYALEGAIFVAGAVVQWLRDGLGVIAQGADTMEMALRGGRAAEPTWSRLLSGSAHPAGTAARAAQSWESPAALRPRTSCAPRWIVSLTRYATCARAMERDGGQPIAEIRADGGAAANNYLMQFQANVLSRPVRRPAMLEVDRLGCRDAGGTGLRGLAFAGGSRPAARSGAHFPPRMAQAERDELLRGWHDAVGRVLSRPLSGGLRRGSLDS